LAGIVVQMMPYERLRAWKACDDLAVAVYRLTPNGFRVTSSMASPLNFAELPSAQRRTSQRDPRSVVRTSFAGTSTSVSDHYLKSRTDFTSLGGSSISQWKNGSQSIIHDRLPASWRGICTDLSRERPPPSLFDRPTAALVVWPPPLPF